MKKRIFLALIILIAFMSVGIISASEISVNDTYVAQDSSENLLAVDEGGVGSNSSNILSIDNVDTNLDENTIGDDFTNYDEIKASDLTLYYKNGTKLTAQLVDRFGYGQADQTLTFDISGVKYDRTTDSQGYASIAINLIPGNYSVGIYCYSQVLPVEKYVNCTVLPTISGDDIVKYYKNDTQYYAAFLKGDGTPLANTDVTFNINGVFYTRTTNASGVARLNINLPPQDQGYILTAIHPETGYMYSNNVTVRPTIISKDLYKVYKDYNQYYATFLTGEGNPLANTDVTFNINGVFYTRTTNASGVARLNINLLAGEYILTAIHPNDTYMLSNMVHITDSSDTYIIAKDHIYEINDEQVIEVQLLNYYDGFGVPNQEIDIIAEGLTDTATTTAMTNDEGMANVTLDLSPGEYIVHYTYLGDDAGTYKASAATSALTIKEGKPVRYYEGISTLYYGMGEKFNVTLKDEFEVPIAGVPVYFRINDGKQYERITDENGTAGLTINMNSGFYSINYKFNYTDYERINDACGLLVIDGPTSTLEGIDWGKYYGSDEKYRVYLNVNKIGLPGRDVIFNINGVNYTRTTDSDGQVSIAINLLPGVYPIKYYYLGEDRINPSSGESYITVKERIVTSLDWESLINYSDGRNINFMVLLHDKNNNPVASKEVIFNIGTNTYTAITDSGGLASIFVSLTGGTHWVSYEFMGDDEYAPSSGYTQITVSDSSEGYGFWSFGADMYNIDLANLAAGGTTDILLNFYAFTKYGEADVLNWIEDANSKGIRVHIWMQVFYSGGSWVNPVSGGSVNQAYFNSVIDEAKYYAGLRGVSGVHFDYLRYPGNAYQTSGGTAAITEFVRQACSACKAINPNIIMSAAVMPETTNDIYYYGQDIPAISQYLDAIIPMQYKGNYEAGTSWLASTTQWFVANSNGASVWSGLQAYVSDDNTATLSYNELYNDAQTVLNSGADGVILFRYGLSQLLKFADLDGYSYGDDVPDVNKDAVSISSIVNGASYVADYYLANLDYPEYVVLAEGKFTIPQFLYLMSKAIVQINDGNFNPVAMVSMDDPSSSGDIIDGELSKDQYIDVFNRVANFIVNNGIVPAYASSTVGKIAYVELVDSSSRILDYYNKNGQLPSSVHIVYKSQYSSKSISELSQSLIKGLTTERAKATALYNYVRDEISYEFYYDTQKGAEGTLTSGGGNCCDQAQLLVAMARSVGLTARFDTGYCYFTLSGSSYGHVWAQILVDGVWYNADPTSTRNSFGEIVNWNTASYTDRGTYDVLPY